jgi:hypothetical protein
MWRLYFSREWLYDFKCCNWLAEDAFVKGKFMADLPDRLKKQEAKNTAFEKTTGKSHFSPNLRAKKTDIAMWCDQGKNEDQILAAVGGGVSREELRSFMAANKLVIKRVLKPGKR